MSVIVIGWKRAPFFIYEFSKQPFHRLELNIFEAKTGKRIGNNLLRSSFITFAYSNNISEALKRSIAEHMGHRIETAERQYNRAPSIIRRRQGLDFASELMATITSTAESGEDSNSPSIGDDDEEGNVAPEQHHNDEEIHYQPAENLQPLFAEFVCEASAALSPSPEQPAPFIDSIFFPEEDTSKEEGPRRSKRVRKIPIRLDVVRIVTEEGREQLVALY